MVDGFFFARVLTYFSKRRCRSLKEGQVLTGGEREALNRVAGSRMRSKCDWIGHVTMEDSLILEAKLEWCVRVGLNIIISCKLQRVG